MRVRSSQPGLGLRFGSPCTQGQIPAAAHLALRIGELEASMERAAYLGSEQWTRWRVSCGGDGRGASGSF